MKQRLKSCPVFQLMTILFSGGMVMYLATLVDRPFSAWLRERELELFDNLMSDSIFEGEILGSIDLVVFILIFCLICYLAGWYYERKVRAGQKVELDKKIHPKLPAPINSPSRLIGLRPYFGFILVNAFCVAVLMAQTIKLIMARPRPRMVLRGDLPFNEWYQVGAHLITDGYYRGSFPSGHTTTIMAMFGILYCLLYANNGAGGKLRVRMSVASIITVALLMVFTRVMNGAHWCTDVVWSFFGGWAITHILFFWGFRLPEVMKNRKDGRLDNNKPYFELLLCFILLCFCVGLLLVTLGSRFFHLLNHWWLLSLILLGVVIMFFSVRKSTQLGLFKHHL